jgi:hypothetical protein
MVSSPVKGSVMGQQVWFRRPVMRKSGILVTALAEEGAGGGRGGAVYSQMLVTAL